MNLPPVSAAIGPVICLAIHVPVLLPIHLTILLPILLAVHLSILLPIILPV